MVKEYSDIGVGIHISQHCNQHEFDSFNENKTFYMSKETASALCKSKRPRRHAIGSRSAENTSVLILRAKTIMEMGPAA
jgi:hypothetical protein